MINHKKKGESSGMIAIDMKISRRRVEQIWKQYKETGVVPNIGINMGRPKKPYDPKPSEIIIDAHDQFKFGQGCLNLSLENPIISIYLIIEFICTYFQKVFPEKKKEKA